MYKVSNPKIGFYIRLVYEENFPVKSFLFLKNNYLCTLKSKIK